MKCNYSFPNLNLTVTDYNKIHAAADSGWVSIGINVEKIEEHFKETCNVKHAIACSSATAGLTIAIKAAGWRDKKIGVPAFTWPSTVYAIESSGANNVPIFKDVYEDSWLMKHDWGDCEAILAVDTFGSEVNINSTLPIIYDAAHGYGLPNLGKRGLAEVVSFSFTKIVTAMEGGIILTDDNVLAEKS